MKEHVRHAFEDSANVKRQFVSQYLDQIVKVAARMAQAFREGNKVILFGNGGSATDASHIAAEFVGRYCQDRHPLPALALTADTAAVTCIANDYAFDEIFARQIRALGRTGDIAIAISTSGNSNNVLKGAEAAREAGLVIIGWTGAKGHRLEQLVDFSFLVPSTITARIQECHITLGHTLCELIDEEIFAQKT